MCLKSSAFRARLMGILALVALILVGCDLPLGQSSVHIAALPDAKQVLRLAIDTADNTIGLPLLDPAGSSGENSDQQALTLIYSGLMTYDASLRPIPALADKVNVSHDGLRYTFHLRRGARFSDGSSITSADVAFSIARLILGQRKSSGWFFNALVGFLPAINGSLTSKPTILHDDQIARQLGSGPLARALLTPDSSTLIIQLAQPDGALLSKLAAPFSSVVERGLALRYGDAWPDHLADRDVQGASGMYDVTGWQPAVKTFDMTVTLKRSATYWGQKPRVRQITLSFAGYYPSVSYQNGLTDVVLGVSQSLDVGAYRLPGFHTAPSHVVIALLLNAQSAPLDDLRLREALVLALNRQTLARDVNATATETLIPPGMPGYTASRSGLVAGAPLSGDSATASKLWQAYVRDRCGGRASACPAVYLYDYSNDWENVVASNAVSMWRVSLPGINVSIAQPPDLLLGLNTTLPWNMTLTSAIEDYPDPQDWMQNWMRYTSGNDGTPFNPGAAVLVAAADSAPNTIIRLTEYQLAQAAIINDALALPIAQPSYAWLARAYVVGFPADPLPWITPVAWARVYLTNAPG